MRLFKSSIFTMMVFSCCTISLVSFLWGIKCPQIYSFVIDSNFSTPFIAIFMHAFETGFVIAMLCGIAAVFSAGCYSQVCAMIVQGITIDMVNNLTFDQFALKHSLQYDSVHQYLAGFSVDPCGSFCPVRSTVAIRWAKMRTPFQPGKISIYWINISDLIFGQWDKNRFEGIMSRHAGVPFTLEPSDIQLSRRVFDLPSIITQCG